MDIRTRPASVCATASANLFDNISWTQIREVICRGFCGAKVLRDATREHLEKFVTQLGDQAARDRGVLLNQLNNYRGNQESAA